MDVAFADARTRGAAPAELVAALQGAEARLDLAETCQRQDLAHGVELWAPVAVMGVVGEAAPVERGRQGRPAAGRMAPAAAMIVLAAQPVAKRCLAAGLPGLQSGARGPIECVVFDRFVVGRAVHGAVVVVAQQLVALHGPALDLERALLAVQPPDAVQAVIDSTGLGAGLRVPGRVAADQLSVQVLRRVGL